jgi:acyl-CoA synthetase (AMP-forming)/AMP-acid ligase II
VSDSEIEQSVRAQLTARGAPFETAVEEVLGVRMRVFQNRARSLRELVLASSKHGDAEYLVDGEERISYVEHLRRVASLARVLHDEYGVRKGDRVAIFAANCASGRSASGPPSVSAASSRP